jgi:hypothetical protein
MHQPALGLDPHQTLTVRFELFLHLFQQPHEFPQRILQPQDADNYGDDHEDRVEEGREFQDIGHNGTVPLSCVQGIAQFALLLIVIRERRFPLFAASLMVWIPALFLPPEFFHPHSNWEHVVWMPCALALIPLQGLAVIEAFFAFAAERRMAAEISFAMGATALPFVLGVTVWPGGTLLQQVVQVALYQRVWCAVFSISTAVFFLIEMPREIALRTEGRHLLILSAWALSWAITSLHGASATWELSLSANEVFWARTALLAAWIISAMIRTSPGRPNGFRKPRLLTRFFSSERRAI